MSTENRARHKRIKVFAIFTLGLILCAALSTFLWSATSDRRLSFMAGYEELRREGDRAPAEQVGDPGAALEVVYRAPFRESLDKARHALPLYGFSPGEQILPGWWTFEASNGELITLIPGNRLSKGPDRNDPQYTSVVLIYRQSWWQQKLDNLW